MQVAWHMQVRKWAVASCKQLSTSIVQGIVIGHMPISQFQIYQVKQLAKVCSEYWDTRLLS